MIAAEVLQCELFIRPSTQMAIIAHIGEMEERADHGQDVKAETTAFRIREALGLSSNIYKVLQLLQGDEIIRRGPSTRVRWDYSAPCYELTNKGWELYRTIRRVVHEVIA